MGMHALNQSNSQADVLSPRPAWFTQQVSRTHSQTMSQQNNAKKKKKGKKERERNKERKRSKRKKRNSAERQRNRKD